MESSPIAIDNGSYEIKFGTTDLSSPYRAINAFAIDKYHTTYLSNQIKNIKDITSVTFRRPHELGQLTSWELESSIWDYALFNPDEFPGFDLNDLKGKHLIASETCMTLPELSKNMDQVVFEEYEFDSYYKSSIAGFIQFADDKNTKIISGKTEEDISLDSVNQVREKEYNDYQLVIDSGFNCTWIIPVIKGCLLYTSRCV